MEIHALHVASGLSRLTSWIPDPRDQRTADAMLRLFFERSPNTLVMGTLLLGTQIVYLWGRVNGFVLLAWAGSYAVLIAVGWHYWFQFRSLHEPRVKEERDKWARRAFWSTLWTGVLGSIWMLIVFHAHDTASQIFVAAMLCLFASSSLSLLGNVPKAYLALILPPAITLVGLFLSVGTWRSAYCAGSTLIATIVACGLLRLFSKILFSSHELRYEREGLLQELERANDAKSRFLAMAGHDLRQPIHALGLLSAQLKTELKDQSPLKTLGKIEQTTSSLDNLVASLVDISTLDMRPGIVHVPVSLASLFDRLGAEFAAEAQRKNLQWRVRSMDCHVASDPLNLERIVRNLLANAMRYTKTGGVLLSAQRRGVFVRIGVWDTGPGIPVEHHARIFDEFVQLDNPGRNRNLGLGLGLSIVSRLCRLLDHPLTLRSYPDKGSRFAIEAPLVQIEPVIATDMDLPGCADADPQCIVALIEDDEVVRDTTASLLRAWGFVVYCDAHLSGLMGQLQPSRLKPHAVISDWRLEQGDGLDAIRGLHVYAGQSLPAMLISGEPLPFGERELATESITLARKPLSAQALKAWLHAPAAYA